MVVMEGNEIKNGAFASKNLYFLSDFKRLFKKTFDKL